MIQLKLFAAEERFLRYAAPELHERIAIHARYGNKQAQWLKWCHDEWMKRADAALREFTPELLDVQSTPYIPRHRGRPPGYTNAMRQAKAAESGPGESSC